MHNASGGGGVGAGVVHEVDIVERELPGCQNVQPARAEHKSKTSPPHTNQPPCQRDAASAIAHEEQLTGGSGIMKNNAA